MNTHPPKHDTEEEHLIKHRKNLRKLLHVAWFKFIDRMEKTLKYIGLMFFRNVGNRFLSHATSYKSEELNSQYRRISSKLNVKCKDLGMLSYTAFDHD